MTGIIIATGIILTVLSALIGAVLLGFIPIGMALPLSNPTAAIIAIYGCGPIGLGGIALIIIGVWPSGA